MRDKRLKETLDTYWKCKTQYKKAQDNYKRCVSVYNHLMNCRINATDINKADAKRKLRQARRDAAEVCKEAKSSLKYAQRLMMEITMYASHWFH